MGVCASSSKRQEGARWKSGSIRPPAHLPVSWLSFRRQPNNSNCVTAAAAERRMRTIFCASFSPRSRALILSLTQERKGARAKENAARSSYWICDLGRAAVAGEERERETPCARWWAAFIIYTASFPRNIPLFRSGACTESHTACACGSRSRRDKILRRGANGGFGNSIRRWADLPAVVWTCRSRLTFISLSK